MAKQITKADFKVAKEARKSFAKIGMSVMKDDVEEFRTKICAADVDGVRDMLATYGEALLVAVDTVSPTALHLAAECGNSEIMQVLLDNVPELKKKFALNSRDKLGETPLHKAACNGHVDIIKKILANNVDFEKRNGKGETALFCAVTRRDFNIAKLLLAKGASISQPNREGQSVLHLAVLDGDSYYVEEILKHGATIDLQNGDGETALHCAVKMGKVDAVLILLANGAAVDQMNLRQETSLHLAIRNDYENVVEILLDNGAKIDVNALALAVKFDRDCILDDLLRRRAEVNALNNEEWKVLYVYTFTDNKAGKVLSMHPLFRK